MSPSFPQAAFFPDLLSEDFRIQGATDLDKYDETDHSDYRRVSWVWHLDDEWHGLRITASQHGQVGDEPSAALVVVKEGLADAGGSLDDTIHFCEECEAGRVGEVVADLAQRFARETA